MSKGLEALKYLAIRYEIARANQKELDIIEKELKELEERREMMRRFNEACVPMVLDNETEKKLKALEIIKNIGILKPYETSGGQCWLETMCDATKITKENYDLLKEVGL